MKIFFSFRSSRTEQDGVFPKREHEITSPSLVLIDPYRSSRFGHEDVPIGTVFQSIPSLHGNSREYSIKNIIPCFL
jgi:hypothetical protein